MSFASWRIPMPEDKDGRLVEIIVKFDSEYWFRFIARIMVNANGISEWCDAIGDVIIEEQDAEGRIWCRSLVDMPQHCIEDNIKILPKENV